MSAKIIIEKNGKRWEVVDDCDVSVSMDTVMLLNVGAHNVQMEVRDASVDKQETVANVVSEMRGPVKPHRKDHELLHEYANRIESSYERERSHMGEKIAKSIGYEILALKEENERLSKALRPIMEFDRTPAMWPFLRPRTAYGVICEAQDTMKGVEK